jgi:subtilisin family serine protease
MRIRRTTKRIVQIDLLEDRSLMTVAPSNLGPLCEPTTLNSAVIRLSASNQASQALKAIYDSGAYVDGAYDSTTWGIVFRPDVARDGVLKSWESSNWLAFSQTDSLIHSTALPVNDPMASQQWAIAGVDTASVNASTAWSRTVGQGVVVAVIDSGIDLNHPDLKSQLWVNTGEVAGNKRDDDRDGFIDDIFGVNFLNNSGNVQDDAGHGSHVSGIIAAAANNNTGGVGLAPGSKIMALKVLDQYGNGSLNAAVNAIYYAVNHGAKVINASWTMSMGSPSLQTAMAYAANRNVVVVTAAGNESVNNDQVPSYPGSYRYTNVLTVGAVDSAGHLASFSNYGPSSVDVAAPGVRIMSTTAGSYQSWDGTSMASPYVAATAALIASLRPDYSAAQIVNQIKATAHRSTELAGKIASAGYLDAGAATDLAPYVAPKVVTPVPPPTTTVKSTTPVAKPVWPFRKATPVKRSPVRKK